MYEKVSNRKRKTKKKIPGKTSLYYGKNLRHKNAKDRVVFGFDELRRN